jgi:nitrate/TMAO reductase-like tetraheme cytochrome c subunit
MNSKHTENKASVTKKTKVWFFIIGAAVALILLVSAKKMIVYTSTDEFCMVCHVHPHAEQTWRLSTHYNNNSGTVVHCVDCHMPPEGEGYVWAKAKHGLKDLYGYLFKDSASFNWEEKSLVEYANTIVYENSCLRCHQNLFPVNLSVNGGNAHLLYTTSTDPVSCLNCHITVGHYDKDAVLHDHDTAFGITVTSTEPPFEASTEVDSFESFTETLPGTRVSFDMVALPGGTFKMGSPEDEPLRDPDEGPVREVTLSPFWIAKTEVTWDEYLAFFRATSSQGGQQDKL